MISWVSVLTCAKRGDYLAETIASLERAGAALANARKLFVDGPIEGFVGRFPGWDVVSVSPTAARGARLAQLEILKAAHAAGVQLLLYFEDDVRVCKNAIRAMQEIGVPPPLGLVTYCDLRWDGRPLELVAFPGLLHDHNTLDQGFLGCQAMAFPARTLERAVSFVPPAWLANDPNNCDTQTGLLVDAWGVLDSLAEHIGVNSAILGREWPKMRVVRGWRGEDFDADAVPRTFELNELGERCRFHAVLHPSRRPCASQPR